MSYTGSTRGQQKSPESGHGIDWLDGLVDWLTDTVESVGDNSRCTVGISTLLGRLSDWLRCVASGGLLVNGDVTTTSCDEKVEDNQGHGFGSRNQKETVRIQNAEYEVMQCTECLEVLAMQLQYLLFPKLTRQIEATVHSFLRDKEFSSSNLFHVVTEEILVCLHLKVSHRWKSIARFLSLKDYKIDKIANEYKQDGQHEQTFKMLYTWMMENGRNATIYQLCWALIQVELWEPAAEVFGKDVVDAVRMRCN